MSHEIKFSISKACVEIILILASFASVTISTNIQENIQNQTSIVNETIFVRSPPPSKSLYSSQLYQPNNVGLMKTLGPYPLRESYIAFEQAHPIGPSGGQNYDEYFKPSKYPPLGYDTSEYYNTRLQNNYPPPPKYHHHHQYQPLYLPLPPPPPPPPFLRLVKIPGDLKVSVSRGISGGNDLEIFCEFPGYVLIVQQIYWHVIPPQGSPLLPYGTFYDSRNGFAPRVTVTSISKWKSVLRVRDYSPDDFGTYRCISTAILPDDPEPTYPFPFTTTRQPPPPPPPPTSYLLHLPHEAFSELRSSSSTIISTQQDDDELKEDLEKMKGSNRGRKIKFRRNKREAGEFGVYAPFFKPHYGIYRVYRQVQFYGDPFGSGSDIIENTITDPLEPEKVKDSDKNAEITKQNKRIGRRKFDDGMVFGRKSKVLF